MSKMLRKKEVYTTITPIPGFIPRQLAIDILHSHPEVITLNPLVLEHKPIAAPRDAASDEFYSTWYEITERIQYIPGMGKMGSGKISFNGCFHDMPWGLQTHIYAPMNVDLRNTYKIAGNQPGVEPPEPPEIGLGALGVPTDGLYLREDIEIKCNIAMVGFVKSQLKAASKEMVSRIIKKAELLDAGVLKAMIHDGKLVTLNPNDRSNTGLIRNSSILSSQGAGYNGPTSPRLSHQGTIGHGHAPQGYYQNMGAGQRHPGQMGSPAPAYSAEPEQQGPIEMPGDFYHPQTSPSNPPAGQLSPSFPPPGSSHENRNSQMSTHSSHMSYQSNNQIDPRWSNSDTQRTSMTSAGFQSPPPPGQQQQGGYHSPPPPGQQQQGGYHSPPPPCQQQQGAGGGGGYHSPPPGQQQHQGNYYPAPPPNDPKRQFSIDPELDENGYPVPGSLGVQPLRPHEKGQGQYPYNPQSFGNVR